MLGDADGDWEGDTEAEGLKDGEEEGLFEGEALGLMLADSAANVTCNLGALDPLSYV
jgi:hypothetical protein